ncbi:MAG: FkbM family methyltransferase [Rubripirellula sp.]|nr:FkbM family methyltransferase [Rubripirellula sp.]
MKRYLKHAYRRLFTNRASYKLNSFLLDCSLHGLGILNCEDFVSTGESHFTSTTLPDWFRNENDLTLFDVGANEGDYTRFMCKAFPSSRAFAIEPHPQTYARMVSSVPNNVTALNVAAGSQPGNLQLYDSSSHNGTSHASLYPEATSSQSNTTAIEIDIDSLDRIALANEIDHIHFLKIDTEGHELEVIKGAQSLIANDAISVLQIEFGSLNLHSRIYFNDIRMLLPGFHFFRLLPKSLVPIQVSRPVKSEIFEFQNIIAVAPQFVSNCGFRRYDLRISAA